MFGRFPKIAVSACLIQTAVLYPLSAAEQQPNIILILVDDMGFSDIGAYGSEIPTPNLDQLAGNGLRFTQFYNASRCCPSRACLLTGLYPHQAGIGHMLDDRHVRGYRGQLSEECVTLAEVLESAGYVTAMTGKWHVGMTLGSRPWERGFQYSLASAFGGVYFPSSDGALYLNGERISHHDSRLPADWYGTDLWPCYGVRFIDEALKKKKPFFLYMAHIAPHFPLQASAEDIVRFKGKYMAGWDAVRQARLERQEKAGLISRKWDVLPRPEEIPEWESLSLSEQDRYDSLMATYAAVVSRLDQSIGTLVSALKERNVLNDTLILFMSDNGGNAESGAPWHPDPAGSTVGDPTTVDSYWLCGQSWAYVENTPFRRYKHYSHEGGISSPLIVHWPDRIKESRWVRIPSHFIDIMPTLVDAAAADYPATCNGRSTLPMEGRSLMPLFLGEKELPERPLFWEHEWNSAMREGDWKLVRTGRMSPWELYNIEEDRTEQHDLSGQMPEKVRQMKAEWKAWADRVHVFPKDK